MGLWTSLNHCGLTRGVRASAYSQLMKRKSLGFSRSASTVTKRSRMAETIHLAIGLTPQERQLVDLLLDVTKVINRNRQENPLVLRFAGGWVRDKLLGKHSQDIDIAINYLTGSAFAEELKKYLEDESNLTKHGLVAEDVRNVHTIKANPEQSKHLETVTTKIFDMDVDMVNLRKETYTDGSRNPEVEFGTAEDDALRRDATINAMFYNIHTSLVEDLVGGIKDLENKLIRTPLDPQTTFNDDPLRVLRLIRFASRYSFEIDPDTEKWMNDGDVLNSFRVKITRERVGEEVKKMLKEKVNNPSGPLDALKIIDRLNLYNTVFSDPNVSEVPDTTSWKVAYTCMSQLAQCGTIYDTLIQSDDDLYTAWLLTAFTPWVSCSNSPTGEPYAVLAAKNGLKTDLLFQKTVIGAFKNYKEVTQLKDEVVAGNGQEVSALGLRLRGWEREFGKTGYATWRFQVLLALVVECMNGGKMDFSAVLEDWTKFINYLSELKLLNVTDVVPFINGKVLMAALGGRKGGPWLKEALEEVCIAEQLKWQLDPKGVSKEDMIQQTVAKVRAKYP